MQSRFWSLFELPLTLNWTLSFHLNLFVYAIFQYSRVPLKMQIYVTKCEHMHFHTLENFEPQLNNLMPHVDAKVASKWNIIGTKLGLESTSLTYIQHWATPNNPDRHMKAFELVLNRWLANINGQFPWSVIINVLESIDEAELAQKLRTQYCWPHTVSLACKVMCNKNA